MLVRCSSWPLVQVLQRDRPDESDHQQGHDAEDHDLQPEVCACEIGDHGGQGAAAKHDEKQIKGQHLHGGEHEEEP